MKKYLASATAVFGGFWGLSLMGQSEVSAKVSSAVKEASDVTAQAAGSETAKIVLKSLSAECTTSLWWIAPVSALISLIIAFLLFQRTKQESEGNEKMREIAGYIKEGAMAYLFRQYKVVGIVFLILLVIFAGLALFHIQDPFVPLAFLTGGFFSALCGFIGMRSATESSGRAAQGATESLDKALKIAFRSGAVMGLVVVGFGLLNICIWYLILDKLVYTPENMVTGVKFLGMTIVPEHCTPIEKILHITAAMITFGIGASTQALFARVGGGIYTKAADVGADLVGKVEAGIPEDDPRNPATIADNVGDNVGDVAGMGADLFESYCNSILATSALGAAVGVHKFYSASDKAAALKDAIALVNAPMIVAGIGIILSIVGIFLVRAKEGASQKNLLRALLTGTLGSSILLFIALAVLAGMNIISWGIFGSIVAGLIAGVLIGQATEYYTSDEYAPTKGVAKQAEMGSATAIIDGLATGMYSTGIPVIVIVIGILCAFGFAGGFGEGGFSMGLYGIGFAAVGMLSTLGITLATDAYGPIADNAGGNAEMSGLPPEVRERTDALDALGNTTAATGKGFAIGSAALTAMALLVAYLDEVKVWITKFPDVAKHYGVSLAQNLHTINVLDFVSKFQIHVINPFLLCGMFIGAMMAFVFCAMTMKAVGRAAGAMVEEVRRQFREISGIMEGKAKPDYAKCVDISTASAQKEMIVPSLLAIIVPVVTGLILGIPGVMGLLAGSLAAGFVLATMLNNAGATWDNAKKYIEKGNLGGKKLPDGSQNPTHAAAVVGDTVGDPCKDTSGPSLNILIKLMSMVSIVFTPVIVKFSPVVQKLLGISFH